MTKIMLQDYEYGGYIITDERDRTMLIQSDLDFPGLAETFGCKINPSWSLEKQIARAAKFLDRHVGKTVEDPGYFDLLETE